MEGEADCGGASHPTGWVNRGRDASAKCRQRRDHHALYTDKNTSWASGDADELAVHASASAGTWRRKQPHSAARYWTCNPQRRRLMSTEAPRQRHHPRTRSSLPILRCCPHQMSSNQNGASSAR